MKKNRFATVFIIPAIGTACFAQSQNSPTQTLTPTQQLARDIFKELIEINTTDTPAGNVTTAAEAMAASPSTEQYAAAEDKAMDYMKKLHANIGQYTGTAPQAIQLVGQGHVDREDALLYAAHPDDVTNLLKN